MKAILLAAGLGTRLRPITDTLPKCMLPICGRPLLDIWLDEMASVGVDEVLVNLHHLPGVVSEHLARRVSGPVVHTSYEPDLLGSAGTLVTNRQWVESEEFFLVCNADNLTNYDLRLLAREHTTHSSIATLTVFRSDQPWTGGVLELGREGLVTNFTEKPSAPTSDLTNAGIYAFHPSVIDEIPAQFPSDIGYDLLPRLVGRARAVIIDGYFRDIGTPESYQRAQAEWPVKEVQ